MKILTPKEVAEILQCNEEHARNIMSYRDFPSFAINKSKKRVLRRVYEHDLHEWLEKQKDGGIAL
ncbi:helix-turn-helix domain-containing protein [Sediminibacillus massiliensis]|uniref:helix-turn-helix domain-containing protein n=1 Tax=Sediminibacillus massiliensis TaxID=1926277 RepID=UPI000988390E|nr:helix-turn-helix domain-containing protein [Sediminibacillus massiliensis]